MSQVLSIGAINKFTGKYVSAKKANKMDKHICPDCGDDLILIVINYFHFQINYIHYHIKKQKNDICLIIKRLIIRKI